MNIRDIKGDATILADNYLHAGLRSILLEAQDAIANITILSMENYLGAFSSNQEDASFYEYYHILKKLKLEYFREVALSCDFIEEMQTFVTQLKQFGIEPSALPQQDKYQEELKAIIKELFKVQLPIDQYQSVLKNRIVLDNFYILDYNPNFYRKMVYEILVQCGATMLDQTLLEPKKEFYYVLNKREEVEALARYILSNKIDVSKCKLTLLSEEYYGFVKQIFNRYQIPFYFMKRSESNRLIYKYTSLIQYYLEQTNETLIKVMEENVFAQRDSSDFCNYISLYNKTLKDDFFELSNVQITKDIISEQELKILQELESRARLVKQEIEEPLQNLIEKNLEEALLYIDELVIEHHSLNNVEDLKVIRNLRKQIKMALPYIEKNTCDLLIHQLEKIKLTNRDIQKGMSVSNLDEMLAITKYHFILGASSDQYPQFKSMSGLFSERYVRHFEYPSIDKRFELHEENLTRNLKTSEHLIVFYATSSLTGKEKEAALEIENFMGQKPQYYSLPFTLKNFELNTKLKPNLSEQLFFKDGGLYGSISSLEKYSVCPFKYFVSKGLKIPEPVDYEFNSAKSGTLMHHILESLAKLYHKSYPETEREIIEELLDEKSKEILSVYPGLGLQMGIVKKRILASIKKNLIFMKSMEEHSSLSPEHVEYAFESKWEINNHTLHLHGYIDRIDMNQDFLTIIDYKSSNQKLTEADVFSCLKLQLLTYLVVAAKAFNRRPIGAYYYSFYNQKQIAEYAKYTKKDNLIVEYENANYLDEFMKAKKLEGWTSSEAFEAFDDNMNHINGIGFKNDGTYTARTNLYRIEGIEELLIDIYTTLIDGIHQGDMRIEPTSCAFCPYSSVCHYRGRSYERKPLEVKESLYLVHKGKEVS